MKMKTKFSRGIDGISNDFLKKTVHTLKLPLCIIMNRSLMSGEFPNGMKIAKVRALYKASGDSMLKDNYRPISLLPVFSKILEKYVYSKLVVHWEKNSVLHPKQFGFRKHHSTLDTFLLTVGEILNSMNDGMNVLSVFIDLRKAFDTINHQIIIDKLKKLGVRDTALTWFISYLADRQQVVSYQDCLSSPRNIEMGVPQGSLFGVLLFELHIDDIRRSL